MDLASFRMKNVSYASISDSIVVSIKKAEKGSFTKILAFLYTIQSLLIKEGIILRGAISIGELYHKDNIVFGPALVQAYELERDSAIYPRCIILKSTLDTCLQTNKSNISKESCLEKFKQNKDGIFYFDYMKTQFSINYKKGSGNHDYMKTQIMIVKEYLQKQINYKPRIQMKYDWLKSYYNDTLSDIEKKYNLELTSYKI